MANLVVQGAFYEKQRRIVLTTSMPGVVGRIQREGDVVHVVAYKFIDVALAIIWARARKRRRFLLGLAASRVGGVLTLSANMLGLPTCSPSSSRARQ